MSLKQEARTLCARLLHGCGMSLWAMALTAILASSTQAQSEHILGRWDPPPLGYDWTFNAEHTIHLPTGKILVGKNGTTANLWDPRDGSFTPVPNPTHNIACSGHTALADGSILAAGGRLLGQVPAQATDQTSIYSSLSVTPNPWREVGLMNFTRWYPNCITLPDGKVLAIGGTDDPIAQGGEPVPQPEIYDPATEVWGDPLPIQPDDTQRTYPFMFVLPDGSVFFAGPSMQTWILAFAPSPHWFEMGNSHPHKAGKGSAVMFLPGWVLKSGGTAGGQGNGENLTSWIDLNVPSMTNGEWEPVDLMENEKRRHNLVMLPDGKILAIGGQVDGFPFDIPIMAAEWFDPSDLLPMWAGLAEMVRPRGHHSTAVLLGDGRVLACGGDDHFDPNFGTSKSAEIFSPPYLFVAGGGLAPRPKIGFAPTVVTYGSDFRVILPMISVFGTAAIEKVSLIRLGSVTHHFDQNQRFVPLAFEPFDELTLVVTAPANGNIAPPGYYMLFLVTDDGVPSEAAYLRLE